MNISSTTHVHQHDGCMVNNNNIHTMVLIRRAVRNYTGDEIEYWIWQILYLGTRLSDGYETLTYIYMSVVWDDHDFMNSLNYSENKTKFHIYIYKYARKINLNTTKRENSTKLRWISKFLTHLHLVRWLHVK